MERAGCPLHRQPTFLFWLQPMDVMVFSPRLGVRGLVAASPAPDFANSLQ